MEVVMLHYIRRNNASLSVVTDHALFLTQLLKITDPTYEIYSCPAL